MPLFVMRSRSDRLATLGRGFGGRVPSVTGSRRDTETRRRGDLRVTASPRLAAVGAVVLLLMAVVPVFAAEKPNIVVFLADDLGYGDVGFQPVHEQHVRTPNIDALAADGMRFTNGYVSAPNCAPSRAALLTGRYQQRYGFYSPPDSRAGLPRNEVTLADVLGKAGYVCGAFGKWHLGLTPVHNPVRRGFNAFYGFLGHGGHDYFNLNIDHDNPPASIFRGLVPINDTGYLTFNIDREACAFIREHRERPFFLYVAFNAVHWPLQAPQKYIAHYDSGDKERDIYLAMLECMDESIGRIVKTLKETGAYGESLIFFLSDNGGAKKVHADNGVLRGFKQNVYEGGIRVPFTVTWPEVVAAGSRSDVPVICQDIFTTAVAAAGADLPHDRIIDGRNLLPILRGQKVEMARDLFWAQPKNRMIWAVRRGDWKLLQERQGDPQLFNLASDPGEKNDLAEKHPQQVRRLRDAYEEWQSRMADPIPTDRRYSTKQPKQIYEKQGFR